MSGCSLNVRILNVIKNNPGEWLSTGEIARRLGGNCTACMVGSRMRYLADGCPGIEVLVVDSRNVKYSYTPGGDSVNG